MLTLAVCPHDTETDTGLKFWKNFVSELEKLLISCNFKIIESKGFYLFYGLSISSKRSWIKN